MKPMTQQLLTFGACGAIIAAAFFGAPLLAVGAEEPHVVPAPAQDLPVDGATDTLVLAGGCFWGVQGVFQHVKGVTSAVSGYAGGDKATAHYETVSTGTTGHAESVQVTFDPRQITYGRILQIYFSAVHDPTQLNRQGPDTGTQYRSAIFFNSPGQERIVKAYIEQLTQAKIYSRPIVTKIVPYDAFYKAEAYHQDYLTLHPNQPYIAYNDLPKVENLKKLFADNYIEKPTLVRAVTN